MGYVGVWQDKAAMPRAEPRRMRFGVRPLIIAEMFGARHSEVFNSNLYNNSPWESTGRERADTWG